MRLTVVDCGEPKSVLWAFPAVSVIEKLAEARNVDRWSSLSRSAVAKTVSVQTVAEVCTIEPIMEILSHTKSSS